MAAAKGDIPAKHEDRGCTKVLWRSGSGRGKMAATGSSGETSE